MERRIEHFQLDNEWRMVSVLGTVYSQLWAIVWARWPFHHRIRYCHLSSFSGCREVPRKIGRDRQGDSVCNFSIDDPATGNGCVYPSICKANQERCREYQGRDVGANL